MAHMLHRQDDPADARGLGIAVCGTHIRAATWDSKSLITNVVLRGTLAPDGISWTHEPATTATTTVTTQGGACAWQAADMGSTLAAILHMVEGTVLSKVTHVAIAVPTLQGMDDRYRAHVRDAATSLGLIPRVHASSTCACVAHGVLCPSRVPEDSVVGVVHVGAATCSVTFVRIDMGISETLHSGGGGDGDMGGDALTMCLVDHCLQDFMATTGRDAVASTTARARLFPECEQAKRLLSTFSTASVVVDALHEGVHYRAELTRAVLEAAAADVLRRIHATAQRVLREAGFCAEDLSDVILTGGTCRMPAVQRVLEQVFGRQRLLRSVEPEDTVVHGAALAVAQMMEGHREIRAADVM